MAYPIAEDKSRYHIAENVGKFSYLGEKTLASLFQINMEIKGFCKIEGENFGDWPSIHQIRQCFLQPHFIWYNYT